MFEPTGTADHARRRRRTARILLGTVLMAALVAPTGPITGALAAPLGNASVIAQWTLIGQSTVLGDATKRPQEAFLYLAFADIAMYDAVVGIDGRFEPYAFHGAAPAGASDQAAAVAAAHRILVNYSPSAQATLDAAYNASLAAIPNGQAKSDGIGFGTAAADALIALRANDGRNAPIFFTQPPAPGVWRPTPPAHAPMFVPWMGAVTPLSVKSGAQFGTPGAPPPLTSKRYTTAFDEVKAMGGATGSGRTPAQTAEALFFSGNATVQYERALVDQASGRAMDIVDAARLFAAVNTSMADAVISVWHSKLLYALWRPITAINLADTDGNPDTAADPSWVPLLVTPPYPGYVSGYSGVTGAFSRSLQSVLGTDQLDLDLISSAAPGAVRHYDTAGQLNGDVIDARVWLGIHFRFDDVDGVRMGQHVANWVMGHDFRPIG
jgi:hypothetical protein